MPGSCDSDNSPSLISSLRNFRFAKQTKKYQTPGQSSPSTSQNSVSNTESNPQSPLPQSPDSTSVARKASNNGTTLSRSPATPSTPNQSPSGSQQYGPLSYRKYDSIQSSQFLLTCIITKFHGALIQSKSHSTELQLTVTNEEINKVKELVLTDTEIAQKWKSCVTYEEHSFNSACEKVLKVNRRYVTEIIRLLKSVYHDNLNKEPEVKQQQTVRTYSRTPKATPVAPPVAKPVEVAAAQPTPNQLPVKVEDKEPKGVMDDYESFCSKEQNLRKLLDAFPGIDIMEAQDILVRCKWNVARAMSTAQQQPVRSSSKKRAHSTSSLDSATSQEPSKISGARTSTTSSVADEIVLDSSEEEEESQSVANSKAEHESSTSVDDPPPSKKPRTRVLSSESEDDPLTAAVQNAISNSAPKTAPPKTVAASAANAPKTSTVVNSTTTAKEVKTPGATAVVISKVVPQNSSDKATRTFTVTLKPVSVSGNNSSDSKSMPNLPKGLVITQVGNSLSAETDGKAQQPMKASTSSNSRTTVQDANKAPQVIRIQSTNGVVTKPDSTPQPVLPKGVSLTPVQAGSSGGDATKLKQKPKRKRGEVEDEDDEEYGNDLIYDSDDSDFEENLTPAHGAVLKFFQESTAEELMSIPGCSKKKVDSIVGIRPIENWADLVAKLSTDKYLSTDLLNGAQKVLDMRSAISKLMTKCQQISLDMEDLVENLKENKESSSGYVSKQPELLNDRLHLTPYQMLGLNWLLLMDNQEVNGILADEMGLGKTVQAIAFLAYLKQISTMSGPHLIVVPSSVMDNWKQEFKSWWPDVSMICYHGSQDYRRELRMQVLNDEVEEFDVMITTYNMVTSSSEDRGFFKRLEFHYVIFDEAHMLKNMASQRYQNLMKIKAPRRLLLTGTPLQNNLVELMSLLIFAMPHMFSGKTEHIKQMFSSVSKTDANRNTYEKDRIDHAKRIMKPFVLRRLKKDVLQELPPKHDETKVCPMVEDQAQIYADLVQTLSAEVQRNKEKDVSSSGAGMMMQLRRAANHPLLLRRMYDDNKLKKMSKAILKEPTHVQSDVTLVFEDMSVMSDFELHNLCQKYKSLKPYVLSDKDVLNSGKFKVLDALLPSLIGESHRILLFSQFTMVLDIVGDYMKIKDYKFLRLDGQVPVQERQQLIDEFNGNPEIPVFLLSTRAGGLGINLTAADTVILHDIDFNPYNDKQAEDRCHRVGQIRDVSVIRLISENTIEEGILQRAREKLKLERDIHEEDDTEENDVASVAKLLRDALGLKGNKS